jgi:uncharacterized protein (DUF2252 family)
MVRPAAPAEQRAAGRAARQRVPRRAHAGFRPAADRDPLAILADQDRVRVPDLVPVRYGRMSTSPFAYFRGQAAVMAADLATTATTGLRTQLCGDAHLGNVGLFATPERRLVFDVNDFDETLPGPFEWDLKRLVASLVLAARHRGFAASVGEEAVHRATERYRRTTRELADGGVLDAWYASVPAERVLAVLEERAASDPADREVRELVARTEQLVSKAQRRTSAQAADRLTETVDGTVRFREAPPILTSATLPTGRVELATALLASYRHSLPDHQHALLDRFQVVDVARRVVGVGSVGTRAYVVLLHGRDADDPLVLQVKEATPSVLEAHLGPSPHRPPGRRVVEGQRLMQAASDVFLGWLDGVGPDGVERHFYVRQFRDMKGSVDLERISATGLVSYAGLCGQLLAHAHTTANGQPATTIGYLGSNEVFADAMVAFARDYADLAERDHEHLVAAIRTGKLTAEPGV